MSDLFDLDAAIGASEPEPFRFTWGGRQFELPAPLAMPLVRQLELIDLIESIKADNASTAQVFGALRNVFGAELLAELNAAKPMGAAALMKLLEAWTAHDGGALGKSPASSPSSGSTAPPSKRTSRSARARKTS